MTLNILILIKFIWFTKLIDVSYNRIPIILMGTSISMLILWAICRSKNKNRAKIALFFYIIISLVMVIDASYYVHFNSLPNILSIKQANQLTAVGDSLKVILRPRILILVIDIVGMGILKGLAVILNPVKNLNLNHSPRSFLPQPLPCHPEPSEGSFPKWPPVLATIILVATITSLGLKGQLSSLKAQELYTYHTMDIVDTILGSRLSSIEDLIVNEELDELKERARLKEGKLTAIGKDKNLIVLQVEALQNFVINLHYKGQEITPNLNKLLADKSTIYYDNYFQLLGRGNTSDAEFVTQNSLYPSMEEPTYTQFKNNTFYGLPWLLRDNGYTAWVFHGYEKEFWNRDKAYINQGFERFLSEEDFEFEDTLGFGIKDEDFFDQTIDYLKELDNIDENPFYAFIITLSSHTPFKMPEEYNVLDIKPEHENMIGDYLNSIHYTDKYIGKFVEDLKREGLYEDTVLAIYGDHFAISTTQDEKVAMKDIVGVDYDFDHMKNIPLMIHIPGEEIHETISTVGSQLDFYPTIMNIMGYDNTKGLVFGRDLTNYNGLNFVAPQTYMLKGSFIDKDILFEISRDGIFERSRAIDRHTREVLDVNEFKVMSEKASKEIQKSMYILKTDYFKEVNR